MELKSFISPEILIAPVEWEYLSSLEKLAAAVRQRGFPCWAYSNKALAKFSQISMQEKENLNKQIKGILMIMDTAPAINRQSESLAHPELGLIVEALKVCQLYVQDSFWDHLQKEDVVEIYNLDNIQLFRTFNFFNISSYSLLDLLINEWYHLYERPSHVLDSFMNLYLDLIEGRLTKTIKVDVATHITKEIYDDSTQYNFKTTSLLLKPGYASPLYDGDNLVKGFIFTFQGQLLGHDSDVENITII